MKRKRQVCADCLILQPGIIGGGGIRVGNRSAMILRVTGHASVPEFSSPKENCMTDAGKLPPLPRTFYGRDPRRVSRDLLGKVLVRKSGSHLLAARIVEVEAYLGENDPAAHSYAGRTARNAVLWGPPGHSYVYFIYGNHYCFNVSCLPDGKAGGVLFRALEPLMGIEEMARARGLVLTNGNLRLLTSGPGRLAESFGITRERDNGKDLISEESDLWIADDDSRPPKVRVTVRIGITKAAERPLRYIIAGNPYVSGKKLL
jgi:DNA-3-methyladenine glycosylase